MDKKQAYDFLSQLNFQDVLSDNLKEAISFALESLRNDDCQSNLPCEIGDKVYIPQKYYYIGVTRYDKPKIIEAYVTEIKFGEDNGEKYGGFYLRDGNETRWFDFSDIDKTVFLDSSKAEIALSKFYPNY